MQLITSKGFWFSAHEQWKVMEMPYYDVDLVKFVPLSPRTGFLSRPDPEIDVSSLTLRELALVILL